ncbi:MAG: TonB-dependent receptor plug domain-containing protein [bacterium]|nr:TonB-dependent receptor plug domain-containing protein [bacterium]
MNTGKPGHKIKGSNPVCKNDAGGPVGQMVRYRFFLTLLMVIALTMGIKGTELEFKDVLNMSLEELMNVEIITAGNKQERIGDIPASVVLINREEIETFGYQSLEQILESVVGVYRINDYQGGGDNFGVRGFWKDAPNSAFVILVNGVPQREYFTKSNYMSNINVPVEAISRLEVVRGPLSVIYGSGAFFGAINIVTNRVPGKKELSGIVSASYGGSDNYRLFTRFAAGKKNGLQLVLNAAVSGDDIDQPYAKMGGFGDWSTKEHMYRDERHFSLSTAHPFGLYANLSHDEETNGFPFLFQPSVDSDNINRVTYTRFNLGVRKQLSSAFGFNVDMVYGNYQQTLDYDTGLFPDAWEIQTVESRFVSVDLALFLTALSQKLDVTIGGNYTAAFDTGTMYDLPAFGLGNSIEKALDPMVTRALYVQGKWHIRENFMLAAGLRFEQALKYQMMVAYNVGIQHVDPDNYYGYEPFSGTEFYDNEKINVIPRLAVIWTLNGGHVLKFLYGEAVNLPAFGSNRDAVGDPLQESVDPETIKTYELNYTAIPSGKFLLAFSVFYNKLNLVARDTGFDDAGVYYSCWANTGKMAGWGFESRVTYKPSDRLNFYGGLSYQEMEDKNHPHVDVAFSPRLLGYIKGSFRFGKKRTVAFTGNYVGAMESFYNWSPRDQVDPDSPPVGRIGRRVPAYFKLGLNVRLEDLFFSGLYANLRISNIMDTDIYYPINSGQPWATRGTLAKGRSLTLTLGWKF